MIEVKRAYDLAEADDGLRFLVDRLWPRGLKREALQLHAWLKEVAPRRIAPLVWPQAGQLGGIPTPLQRRAGPQAGSATAAVGGGRTGQGHSAIWGARSRAQQRGRAEGLPGAPAPKRLTEDAQARHGWQSDEPATHAAGTPTPCTARGVGPAGECSTQRFQKPAPHRRGKAAPAPVAARGRGKGRTQTVLPRFQLSRGAGAARRGQRR